MTWADLTTIDAKINGLSNLTIVILGIVLFLHLCSRYSKTKRLEILITAFALFSLGCCWLGGATNFILVILTGSPLEPKQQVVLYSWAPPLSATLWVYLGFRLAKPQFQYHALGISMVVDTIHLFASYVLVPLSIPEITQQEINLGGLVIYYISGNLAYTSYRGILLVTTLIFVLSSVLLVGPLFLWLSYTTDRAESRLRGRLIGFGAILLGTSTIIDEVLSPSGVFSIMTHLGIAFSMVLLYLGYLLPQLVRRLVGID